MLLAFLWLFLLSAEGGCNSEVGDGTNTPKILESQKDSSDMKIFGLNLFGDDYSAAWKKVQDAENNGLTEDALKLVRAIYQKANDDKNSAQRVKSILYLCKYTGYIEENSELKSRRLLLDEIEKSAFPLKNILQSILADMYWQYFNSNRYAILQRSDATSIRQEDFLTWDATYFTQEIMALHLAAIENPQGLQQIAIKDWEVILADYAKSDLGRKYRPTLYDFLAHRALDYFMDDQANISKAADQFQITDSYAFADAKVFGQKEISTSDPLSVRFHAVKILQALTNFHLNDEKPDPLIDVELKRLKFGREKSTLPDRKEQYLDGLERLRAKYSSAPAVAFVLHEIALWYFERGGSYVPEEKEDYKGDRAKALQICSECVRNYAGTPGVGNCEALLNQIRQKELTFQAEQANLPAYPFRALLTYRNVEKLYCRTAKVTDEIIEQVNAVYEEEKRVGILRSLPAVEQWTVKLPKDPDYNMHRAEMKVPRHNVGRYVLIVSTDEGFTSDGHAFCYQYSDVTNLSLLIRNEPNRTLYYVLHRETGQLMSDVQYKVKLQQWNYQSRKYEDKLLESGKTDKEGYFVIKGVPNQYGQLRIELSKDNDYYTHGDYLRGTTNTDRQESTYLHFFTDRSIYRPGQTVYFKGILLRTDGKNSSLQTNHAVSVTLKDVNWQDVATLNFTTNEYGSLNGKFTLPTNLLNGTMHLHSNYGQVDVQVEEYKRPKFAVSFEPVKGSFRLNEVISVVGRAKAYAGNAVDNASVSYRVVRKARYPDWWWWWRMPQATSNELEIGNGKVTTDADGNFTVTFTALPDPTIDATTRPQYNYEVIADVTDLNGETRTGTTQITVGYTALNIALDLPDDLNKRDENKFGVSSTNLSGQPEGATLQLTVYELEQPNRLLRARLWEKPDKFILSEKEYVDAFPNDIYNKEDDPSTWAKKRKVVDVSLSTPKDSVFKFSQIRDLNPGRYIFEMTANDKYGEKVEWRKIVTVFDPQSDDMPGRQLWWNFIGPKKIVEPGGSVEIAYGSSAKDAFILLEVIQEYNVIRREWLSANADVGLIIQKIGEDMRGGFSIGLYMVRLNRFYTTIDNISVPWSNKELTIETATFRSTLYPGQEEQWQLKISGPKKEKIAAEMVATMYDASLDAFRAHNWYFNIYPTYGNSMGQMTVDQGFGLGQAQFFGRDWNKSGVSYYYPSYDQLNWFGFQFGANYYSRYAMVDRAMPSKSGGGARAKRGAVLMESAAPPPAPAVAKDMADEMSAPAGMPATELAATVDAEKSVANSGGGEKKGRGNEGDFGDVKIRKNLQELAFFMPDLRTDSDGNININFTAPEALTEWRLLAFGHSKDLLYGQFGASVVTQKDLMVMPNMPRFLRENDEIYLSAKISNLTDKLQQGSAALKLFDALTMQPIDVSFGNKENVRLFTADPKQSFPVEWRVRVPDNVSAVVCQIVAKAGNVSDGEENALPVLTNKMLVTESLPLPVRGKSTKKFTFENLTKADRSNTLKHHSYTLEFTSNPSWYAVQALPYMMEYPYECTEQIFSRYYANSIASHIASSSPNIKKVFDTWRADAVSASSEPLGKDAGGALLSNLEKNQELKQLLLEETPWVLNAKDESERKKRVGLLFDLEKMGREEERVLEELQKRQTSSGGWTWFPGMPNDRYMTQHIICGMGHLDKLGVSEVRQKSEVWNMVEKAVRYLDSEMYEDYQNLLRHKINLAQDNSGYMQLQYLYMRSFFTDIALSSDYEAAFNYWKGQAEKYWLKKGTYMQAMIALSVFRHNNGDSKTATDIIKSLAQNTVKSDEMGWYFKDNMGGWYWYQAPIETQALVIEAFDEVANDRVAVHELRIWLLKQKQTQDWKTTKATAEACYALLLRGNNWLANQDIVDVVVGKYKVNPKDMPELKLEAGTGYYKTRWQPDAIGSDMGNITVSKNDESIGWGAVYWQYFEQLDKITPAETPLKINKQLFKEVVTKGGLKLEPLANGASLKVGDKVKVRVEVRVDRDMEYVHLKDMRAAGFEPINVISQYKYQDGLGYYESTKDAATNFFMGWLPKGTYVFEYPLRVSHKGNFSNGITTMQCMYAPEFSSHSEGIRVTVE